MPKRPACPSASIRTARCSHPCCSTPSSCWGPRRPKTSAIEFLLQSIFATQDNVACVCFNVKGHDMLFLDYPDQSPEDPDLAERYEKLGVGQLTPDDFAMYDALGVPCEAFRDVHYYAPYKEDQFNLSTLRSNPDVTHNVSALAWGLTDILEFAEVVLNRDDIDAKADAFIQYINQTVIRDENGIKLSNGDCLPPVRTFQDLERWFRQLLKHLEDEKGGRGEEQFRTHNVMTIRKVYNRLSNLVTRYRGLLVERDERCADLPWGEFKPGSIYVIDIAKMDAQGQDLVVTRVVSKLREYLEKKKLGVEKCVVVVDELNKYAPSDGPETYLKKTLLDISERGRYIGLVLFSAQQFRSQVHKRVVGNCGTSMYGRMDMDELSTPGYQVLSRAEREKLATLSKGQLMVRHPHFSQAIFVKFPRPNILRVRPHGNDRRGARGGGGIRPRVGHQCAEPDQARMPARSAGGAEEAREEPASGCPGGTGRLRSAARGVRGRR